MLHYFFSLLFTIPFLSQLCIQIGTKWVSKCDYRERHNKISLMSWKFYADTLSPVLSISRCFISGKSDFYHCLLSNAGAPPQLVKTACLNLHTSDRITALGVLVCWQQFILMCCHNMEFFNALHYGANKSQYIFFSCQMRQV